MKFAPHILAAALLAGTASVSLAAGSGTQSGSSATQATQSHGGQTATGQSEVMKAENIRKMLEARGYSDVGDFQYQERSLVVDAKRYGEDVELKVDPITGAVEKGDQLSEDQIEKMLEEQGYDDVSDISRDGDTFTAKAERDGDKVKVDVNRDYGVIIEERERSS